MVDLHSKMNALICYFLCIMRRGFPFIFHSTLIIVRKKCSRPPPPPPIILINKVTKYKIFSKRYEK